WERRPRRGRRPGPRPQPPAPPGRRAPRSGVDDPVQTPPRPPRLRGLTTPAPATAPPRPRPPGPRQPRIPSQHRTSRRTSKRQEPPARLNNKISFAGPGAPENDHPYLRGRVAGGNLTRRPPQIPA